MEPNCVQYLVYFDDVSSCAQLEEKKNDIFKHVERDFAANDASLASNANGKRDVYDAYCYHREGFNLTRAFCSATQRFCLKGSTHFGDCIDDEWMVAHVLTRVSERFEDISVRIFDDDGEFLLIECSHVLPTWVEPNVAEGRTFIRHGAVHVVYEQPEDEITRKEDREDDEEPFEDIKARKEDREDEDEDEREDRMKALKTNVDALNALIKAKDQKKYRLGDAIQKHLKNNKMKKYYQTMKEAIVTSRHLARVVLPKRVRRALQCVGMESMQRKQTFIQLATRAFYERTPADVRSSKDFRNLNFNTPAFAESNARREEEEEESSIVIQDDAMMNEMDSVTLRFSRCAYAQLARAKFDAPRKYPMDVIAKTTDADLHNAFDIGMKLTVGMEIALEKLLMSSEDDSLEDEDLAKTFNAEEIAAILQFKDALERVVETKEDEDEEEDVQNLEPESDQWMRDGMRDLDNEILARAAEREMHPLSDDDEDGRPSAFDDEFDFDDDLKDDKRREKEKAFSEDVKRVGKKLGTFMNAKATYKGAEEVQRANNINNNGSNNSSNSYSKVKKKIAPPELDADAFERDLMNALMDDPESEQFLEQFTKDLAFHDNPKDDLRRKVEHDVVQNELDLQAEDFDVAYEAALREQLLGSHVEESVKRTTTTKTTTIDANDEESIMESETIKDVLKSAVMQNGQSGPATILLGTLRDEEEEA